MSVSGIDFGNHSILIGQAGKGGVDVILNGSSNRLTASFISVQGKQRFFGDSAAAMARSQVTNTISMVKLLVGRHFDDPDTQAEMAKVPFRTTKMAHGGVGVIINYNDQDTIVSAEHLFAMLLILAQKTSMGANNGLQMADAVLAVPHWFTDSQRRGIANACEIAGLNCLKIANESTNIALGYGIFKSAKGLFSETEPTHVMFIDFGYTGYCVSIVDFKHEQMSVRSTVCDNLGGRNFDDVIIEFLAETFQKKTGVDVRKNKKAMLKLEAAAEKAKKTLSPAGVTEANISVECLANDQDLNAVLTRDEFEKRVSSLVARLEGPITTALNEAGLTREQLKEVEIVGGSTRINIVKRRLGEILGLDPHAMNYGLKTTMNADEPVARGGALQAAMLSSRIRVKPFHVTDRLPYGVIVEFDETAASGASGADEEGAVDAQGSTARIYSRNDEVPHKPRRLTFRKKGSDIRLRLRYDDESASFRPRGENAVIADYVIKVSGSGVSGLHDVRVNFDIDKHGCVHVQSAQLMEEYFEEVKEEGKEPENKKKFKKVDLAIETHSFGLTKQQIKEAIEVEAQMANEDRLIIETANARNELESYLYAMRDKIDGALKDYSTPAERTQFHSDLTEAEDWLYNEGFETTKSEYVRKLEKIRVLGDKIEFRFNEVGARQTAIAQLQDVIAKCKAFTSNYDSNYSHITDEDRAVVRNAVASTESWLYDMMNKVSETPLSSDPVFSSLDVSRQRTTLFTTCNPIMIKPKPKPAPEAKPEEKSESKQEETKAEGADSKSDEKMDTSK